jgi:hypothetical protein
MRIELITCFYREEFLRPLFDLHYHWVDTKTIITTERGDGKFDDEDKMNWVNDAIARSTADWVVLVDMDEFIYPVPWGCNPRIVLEQETGGVVYSHMSRVWRHRTDADIDPTKPPVPQRLHGQKDHVKPCVFRPTGGVKVGAGNHNITVPWHRFTGKSWAGAHWANADCAFWVDRETRDRGPRLSERNKQRGFGIHTLRTKEQILAECERHLDDPVIIKL